MQPRSTELRKWLISNNVIKSDYEAKRDEYLKLVTDNWNSVTDTSAYWKTWTDSDLRNCEWCSKRAFHTATAS